MIKTNELQYDVSIIVPVYNREDIIKPCIESINSQTYDKSKWEVIFIDDASTDDSINTIKSIIDEDVNYRILKRPVGSGNASAPRNEGIKASSSKYVFFLDSDDYIDPELLENGMAMALRNDSDMVYVKVKAIGRNQPLRPFKIEFVEKADVLDNHLIRFLSIFKFYKVKLLKQHNILFLPTVSVAEDQIFSIDVLSKSNTISIIADKYYYFLQAHEGEHLSKKKVPLENFFKVLEYSLSSIYFSDQGFDKKSRLYNAWIIRVVERFVGLCKKRKLEDKELIKMFQLASNYFNIHKELFDLSQIYKNEKILTLLFLTGDFSEFHKIANESKVLNNLNKVLNKQFENLDGFSKSWIYNNKAAVVDFKLMNNKLAFDIEIDEKKKFFKVWMFSRNIPESLSIFENEVMSFSKNRYLISEYSINQIEKVIESIDKYLEKVRGIKSYEN